jgi:hypothetical protein
MGFDQHKGPVPGKYPVATWQRERPATFDVDFDKPRGLAAGARSEEIVQRCPLRGDFSFAAGPRGMREEQ